MGSRSSLRTSPAELASTSEPAYYTGISSMSCPAFSFAGTQPKPPRIDEEITETCKETSPPPPQSKEEPPEVSAPEVSSSSSAEPPQVLPENPKISEIEQNSTQIESISSNVEQKPPKLHRNASNIKQNASRFDEKLPEANGQPPPNMADVGHNKMVDVTHEEPIAHAQDKMVDVTQQKSTAHAQDKMADSTQQMSTAPASQKMADSDTSRAHAQHKMADVAQRKVAAPAHKMATMTHDSVTAHAQHKVTDYDHKKVEITQRTIAERSSQTSEFRLLSVEFRNPCTDYERKFRKYGKLTLVKIQWAHSSKIPFYLDPRRLKQLKRELMEELKRKTPVYGGDDAPEVTAEVPQVDEEKSLEDEARGTVLSETRIDDEEESKKNGENEDNDETVETVETLGGTMGEHGENVVSSSNSEEWERCSTVPTDIDEGIASSSSSPSHSPTRESPYSNDTSPRSSDVPELLADSIGSATSQIPRKHSIKFNPLNRKVKSPAEQTDTETCPAEPLGEPPIKLNCPRSPAQSPKPIEKPENFFVKGANLKTVKSENPSILLPRSGMSDESNHAASAKAECTSKGPDDSDAPPARPSEETAKPEEDAKTPRKSLQNDSDMPDVSEKPRTSSQSDKSRKRDHSSHSRSSEGHKKHRSSSASSESSRKHDRSPSSSTSRHSDGSRRHKKSGKSSKKREHSPRDDAVPLAKRKSEAKGSESKPEDDAKSRDSSTGSAVPREGVRKSEDAKEPTLIGSSKKRRMSRLAEAGTRTPARIGEGLRETLDRIKQKERQGKSPKQGGTKTKKTNESSEVDRRISAAPAEPREVLQDPAEVPSTSRNEPRAATEAARLPENDEREDKAPDPEQQWLKMYGLEAAKTQPEKSSSVITTGDYLGRQRLRIARDVANIEKDPLAQKPKPASAVRRAQRASMPPQRSPNARADPLAINASVPIDESVFQGLAQEPLPPLIPVESPQVVVDVDLPCVGSVQVPSTSGIISLGPQLPSTSAIIPQASQVPSTSGLIPQALQVFEDANLAEDVKIPLLGDGQDGSQGSDAMDIDSDDPYGEHTLNSVETVILETSPSLPDVEMTPVNCAEASSITTSAEIQSAITETQSTTIETQSAMVAVQSACLTISSQSTAELHEPDAVDQRPRSPSLLEQMIYPDRNKLDKLTEEFNKFCADIAEEQKANENAQTEPLRLRDGPQPEVRDEDTDNAVALPPNPNAVVPIILTPLANAPKLNVLRNQLTRIDQLYEDIVILLRVIKYNRRELKEVDISDIPEEVKVARNNYIWIKLVNHITLMMGAVTQLEHSEEIPRKQVFERILEFSLTMTPTFHVNMDDIVFICNKFEKMRGTEMVPPPSIPETRELPDVQNSTAGYNPLDKLQDMNRSVSEGAREVPPDSTSKLKATQSSDNSIGVSQVSTATVLSSKLFAGIPQANAIVPQTPTVHPRPENQQRTSAPLRPQNIIQPQVNITASGGSVMLPRPMPVFKQPPSAGNPPSYAESLESIRQNKMETSPTYQQNIGTNTSKMAQKSQKIAQPPLPSQPYPQRPPAPNELSSVAPQLPTQQSAPNQFIPPFMVNQGQLNMMPNMMNQGQVPPAMMNQMQLPPNVITQGPMLMPTNVMRQQGAQKIPENMERCFKGECHHAKPCNAFLALQKVYSQVAFSGTAPFPPGVYPQSGVGTRDPRSRAQNRQVPGFPLNVPQSQQGVSMPQQSIPGFPPGGMMPQHAAQYGGLAPQYAVSMPHYSVPSFQPGMLPMQTQTSPSYQGQFPVSTQGVFAPQQGRPVSQQPTSSRQSLTGHSPMISQGGFVPQRSGPGQQQGRAIPQETKSIPQQPNIPSQYARSQIPVSSQGAPGFQQATSSPQYQSGQFHINPQANQSLQHGIPISRSVGPTHQQQLSSLAQSSQYPVSTQMSHLPQQQRSSATSQVGPVLMNSEIRQATQQNLPQQKLPPSSQSAVLMNAQVHQTAQQAVPRSQHQAVHHLPNIQVTAAQQGFPPHQSITSLPGFHTLQPNTLKPQQSQSPQFSRAQLPQANQPPATSGHNLAIHLFPQQQAPRPSTKPPSNPLTPQKQQLIATPKTTQAPQIPLAPAGARRSASITPDIVPSSTSPAASRTNPPTPLNSPLRHLLTSISPVSSISVSSPQASPRDPPTVTTPRSNGPSPLVFRNSPKPSAATPPIQWSSVSQSQESLAPSDRQPTLSASQTSVTPSPAVSPMPTTVRRGFSQSMRDRPLDLTTRRLSASPVPMPLTPAAAAEPERKTPKVEQTAAPTQQVPVVKKEEILVIDLSDDEEDQKPNVSDLEVAQCIASIDEELAMVKAAQEMRIQLDTSDTFPVIGEVMTITADQFEEMNLESQDEEVVEDMKMEAAVEEEGVEGYEEDVAIVKIE